MRDAPDQVTFVVTKNKEVDTSIDDISVPSLPYETANEIVKADGTRIKTREVTNDDGSQTIIAEFFDVGGRKQKQTTRRRRVAPDGSKRDISFSSLSASGEMTILVSKSTPREVVGLRLEKRRNHRGQNAIFVSQVFPSGLFARTPLSVGDIVASINDIDFSRKPDIQKASDLMSRTKSDIKVTARKPAEWIEQRKQRICQSRQLVETFTIDPPKSQAYQFDSSSYDDSFSGYNSTKKVSLKDFSASERLGVIIASQYTRWGMLLVAKDVAPSSRLAALGLKNGDVIISINGFDMKSEPDASRAMHLIRNSENGIEIEYQRLQNLTEGEAKSIPVARMESFRPDGTKCTRTETWNPDGSILVRIEEVGPLNPVDAAVATLHSGDGLNPDVSHISTGSSHFQAVSTSFSGGRSPPLEPISITVHKSKRFPVVGLDLVVTNGLLRVAGIAQGGLLFGKPLLPGDTVLEINGQDFRKNPSVRRAESVLSRATKSITFTILKTSLLTRMDRERKAYSTRKKGFLNRLTCGKTRKGSTKAVTFGKAMNDV